MATERVNKIRLCLALLCLAASLPGHAQTPAWSGSVRCDVTITGSGYTDRLIHVWQAGGTPTQRGAFKIYPGTWSVSGGGSLTRATDDQTLQAQWVRSVEGMSGPISVFVRASDGAVIVQPDHAQLRGRGAVSGAQEVRRGGQLISSTPISAEAFEHAFPSIKGNSTSTQLSGQASDTPKGSFGFMQPGDASVRVSCAWDFRRSDYTGGAPQNPATLPPPATPPTSTPPTTPPTPPVGAGTVPPPAMSPAPPPTAPPTQRCEQLEGAFQAVAQAYSTELGRFSTPTKVLSDEYIALINEKSALGNRSNRLRVREIDARIAQIQNEFNALSAEMARATEPFRRDYENAFNAWQAECGAGASTTTPPTSTPPPPGGGNAPVQTPPAVPTAADCAARLAQMQANFDQQEAASELQYSRLLAEKTAERARIVAELAELQAEAQFDQAADRSSAQSGSLSFAKTIAALKKVDEELAALRTQKTNAIAAIRRNALRAASAIRLNCSGATQGR